MTIANGAELFSAASSDVDGGQIILHAANGNLSVETGSTFNSGANGNLRLRAQRNSNDINITNFYGSITETGEVIVEAVKVYESVSSINSGLINAIQTDTSSYMQNSDNIKSRLSINNDERYQFRPGVEIQNDGNISLDTDWNLSGDAWRL